MIIYLAALVGVRPELYDAAEVDGASIWQKIRYITLPQLRNVLFLTLILQLIATAQLFTEPFLFTGGGPANATMTVLLLIYKYAFQNSLGGDYGMAAALSLMLAAVPRRVHRRLLLADPALEHGLMTAAADGRRDAARDDRPTDRRILSAPTGASANTRWTMRAAPGRDPAFLLIVGLGPMLWMLKSSITPDARHPAPADGAVAERLRPVAVRDGLERGPHRPLPVATRWSSPSGRGRPRSPWRTTAGFALSVLRPRGANGSSRRSPSRPCSCRRSCCSCRST